MPLFQIQDTDRPAFVFAENYAEAESKWRSAVSHENDDQDPGPCQGISYICDDNEIIVGNDWLA